MKLIKTGVKLKQTIPKGEVIFVGRKKRNSNELELVSKTYEMPVYDTDEALENAMVAAATRLAYQQLMDGTASSQVITHYLKLGSTKERIEQEILKKQAQLIAAKTEAIKDQKKNDEIYRKALDAFRTYSGQRQEVDEDEELL